MRIRSNGPSPDAEIVHILNTVADLLDAAESGRRVNFQDMFTLVSPSGRNTEACLWVALIVADQANVSTGSLRGIARGITRFQKSREGKNRPQTRPGGSTQPDLPEGGKS